jgi:hypothetical protein
MTPPRAGRWDARRRDRCDPETRVGICCGCHQDSMLLYKVPNIYRYRCDECFEKETGFRHPLSPAKAKSPLILP